MLFFNLFMSFDHVQVPDQILPFPIRSTSTINSKVYSVQFRKDSGFFLQCYFITLSHYNIFIDTLNSCVRRSFDHQSLPCKESLVWELYGTYQQPVTTGTLSSSIICNRRHSDGDPHSCRTWTESEQRTRGPLTIVLVTEITHHTKLTGVVLTVN